MSTFCVFLLFLVVIRSSHEELEGALPPRPDTGLYTSCYIIINILLIIITGVRLYLGEEVRVLPDFSMISGGQFHNNDRDSPNPGSPSDGLNDGLWCQSANNGSMIGTWYLPNGTQLTTEDIDISDANFPLYAYHVNVTGQIGLLRDAAIASLPGLYSCVIPDENEVNQTLWVAIYGGSDFDSMSKFV